MSWIRRRWTAVEADEWTREDWIAIVISPVVYVLLLVGTALALLFRWEGFVLLGIGIVLGGFMHWVIDPKLKAVSEEYESKQRDYLRQLEAATRWQEEVEES